VAGGGGPILEISEINWFGIGGLIGGCGTVELVARDGGKIMSKFFNNLTFLENVRDLDVFLIWDGT